MNGLLIIAHYSASLAGLADEFLDKSNFAEYKVCRIGVIDDTKTFFGCRQNATDLDALTPLELLPIGANVTQAIIDGAAFWDWVRYLLMRRMDCSTEPFQCYNNPHIAAEPTCAVSGTWPRRKLIRAAQTGYFVSIVVAQVSSCRMWVDYALT